MNRLHRSSDLHARNISHRRAAQAAAASLWNDVVHDRVKTGKLDVLEAADRRYEAALVEFGEQIHDIMDSLERS